MSSTDFNLDQLVEHLSTMGRCGRHFTVHHHFMDHDYACRRATKALELADPFRITDFNGDIFWGYVVEFIEAINGGVFYGLPGMWLEVPHTIAYFDREEIALLREKPRHLYEQEILPKYKIALRAALRECYRPIRGVNLSEYGLINNGLKQDKEIDYDDL